MRQMVDKFAVADFNPLGMPEVTSLQGGNGIGKMQGIPSYFVKYDATRNFVWGF